MSATPSVTDNILSTVGLSMLGPVGAVGTAAAQLEAASESATQASTEVPAAVTAVTQGVSDSLSSAWTWAQGLETYFWVALAGLIIFGFGYAYFQGRGEGAV